MQKWWIILFVIGISSCHKELIATDDAGEMELVRNYVGHRADASTLKELDWFGAETILDEGVTVGYKVPLANGADNQYRFLLIDAPHGKFNGLFLNEIEYSVRPEGMIPETIRNHNFQTGESYTYNAHKLLTPELPGIQLDGELASIAAGFKVPPVTAIGIYNNDGTATAPSSLKEIRTYVLAYLVGLDVNGFRGRVLTEVPEEIHFYNPLYNAETDKNIQVFGWEIGD